MTTEFADPADPVPRTDDASETAVQRALRLTRDEIRRLAANSIAASFLATETKEHWLRQIDGFAVGT